MKGIHLLRPCLVPRVPGFGQLTDKQAIAMRQELPCRLSGNRRAYPRHGSIIIGLLECAEALNPEPAGEAVPFND